MREKGLRVPSEVLSLKWADVNLEKQRILVTSPKTEHHVGRESRDIPMFPELVEPLRDVLWGLALLPDGGESNCDLGCRKWDWNLRSHI